MFIGRRGFMTSVAATAATLVMPPQLIAAPREGCGNRRVIRNGRWQNPGRDQFGKDHRDAVKAVRALERLTPEMRRRAIQIAELLADEGWNSSRVKLLLAQIKRGDFWHEMVNGCTHHVNVMDMPHLWSPEVPRDQFLIRIWDENTRTYTEVSVPRVCHNPRMRQLEEGQVNCVPPEDFGRTAVAI